MYYKYTQCTNVYDKLEWNFSTTFKYFEHIPTKHVYWH